MKISFAIITKNEEKAIATCINSISPVADEIVVLDSFSTDNTQAICKDLNVVFHQQEFLTFARQKQRSVELCSHDFVFCIDADESIDDEMTNHLLEIKKRKEEDVPPYFFVKRKNFDGDHWIKYGGFYPDPHLRFFDRKLAYWGGPNPHEKVVYNQSKPIHWLKGNLLHYKVYDKLEFEKLDQYAKAFAINVYKNRQDKSKTLLKKWVSPFWTFISIYLLKLGFLEGKRGLMLAKLNSQYTKSKYKYLIQIDHSIQQNINVLFDCERMKYPNTGSYTYCKYLSIALKKSGQLEREKIHFYVPNNVQNNRPFFENTYPVSLLHALVFKLPKKYNIYHCTDQRSKYFPIKVNGLKIVLTIHDLNFLIEKESKVKINSYLKALQRKINKSDKVICISDFVKQDVMKHLKVDPKKIVRVYNGSKMKVFPNFDEPIMRPNGKFIFSIGTVLPKKNFHVCLHLLVGNDLFYVIAGLINKAYARKIVSLAVALGVQDRVILTDAVDEKSKYWYYKHCEAFVFPSLAEGFGLPVIEAMQLGKPCFVSTECSLPEIGGKYAYYFENFLSQTIREAYEKGMEDYRKRQPKEEIIKWSEKFTWKNTAKQYIQIYQELGAGL